MADRDSRWLDLVSMGDMVLISFLVKSESPRPQYRVHDNQQGCQGRHTSFWLSHQSESQIVMLSFSLCLKLETSNIRIRCGGPAEAVPDHRFNTTKLRLD
ncbi:hypothetical protein MGYG_08371 [Nannizzia gypsea CBS 118893]|uniref:Uncharacterized protein n=1 Tax=Arthroderma gypseum (strain ATCC MYA-4604 / CBS 118893) TaxID=535722 RepID=E4V5I5_ARTGP|nr:hypothetical protein MGYG_08371 [Nannizzia gypsea CBS 118893]EFR05360.1 hypothetical protein MGYG_08371 [Nannizzia gypsea CBS 118893]